MIEDYSGAVCGLADVEECGLWAAGIPRLKQSAAAPSRSALKLEEAIVCMLDDNLRQDIGPGASAIDLGAAPGGWSSVLLKRGVFVTGVDHGEIDAQVLAAENFIHSRQDAFKFKPKQPSDLLVCDVVENPFRIADLVNDWSRNNYFKTAIVNLKLPMNKRYEAVQQIRERLLIHRRTHVMIKHLYHDRDEVTAILWKQ
jgi:23S rRNA (cytidine2498-2'-O)-methyltransferase